MYITNHMIISKNEKTDIAKAFENTRNINDITNNEALFIMMSPGFRTGIGG